MPKSRRFYVILFVAAIVLGLLPVMARADTGSSGNIKIRLKTLKTIPVGNGTSLDIHKNVVKSISPSSKVKRISINPFDKSVSARVSHIHKISGVVESRILKFSKPGVHKVQIVVSQKGSKYKAKKTVRFRVRRNLSKEIRGLGTTTAYLDEKFNYREGVYFDKSRVKSYSVDSSRVHLDKLGTYTAKYRVVGTSGETVTVKRTIKVVNNPNVTPKSTYDRIMSSVDGLVDRGFISGSTNISLWYGVKANSTVDTVTLDVGDIKNAPDMRSTNPFYSKKVTYTVVFKDGEKGKVTNTIYFVDEETGRELANRGIDVYCSDMESIGIDLNLLKDFTVQVGQFIFDQDAKKVYVCSECGKCFSKVIGFNEHIQGSLDGGNVLTRKVPKLSIVCPCRWILKSSLKER